MLGSSLYQTVSNTFFGTLPRIRVNSFRKKNKETVVQSSYIRMLFNFKLFAQTIVNLTRTSYKKQQLAM